MRVLWNDPGMIPQDWEREISQVYATDPGEAWLYVTHLDTALGMWLREERPQECLRRGGAILFVSRQRRSGMLPASADQVQRENNGRVHFLDACHNPPQEAYRLLRDFLLEAVNTFAAHGPIPWDRLYPDTDPNLAQRLKERYGET